MTLDPAVQAVLTELEARIARDNQRFERDGLKASEAALEAGPETAGLLNLLVRATGAKRIVEVGTSLGYTALWLGEAARATGGTVIGTEKIDSKHAQARDYLARAGLGDVVEVRLGDAKEVVAGIDGPIDLAFVDAWKADYIDYFELLLPKLRVGGTVVADNITYPESARETMRAYQAHVAAKPNVRSHFLPIGNGLEMSVRVA